MKLQLFESYFSYPYIPNNVTPPLIATFTECSKDIYRLYKPLKDLELFTSFTLQKKCINFYLSNSNQELENMTVTRIPVRTLSQKRRLNKKTGQKIYATFTTGKVIPMFGFCQLQTRQKQVKFGRIPCCCCSQSCL